MRNILEKIKSIKEINKSTVTSHRALFLQESKEHYWCGWRRKWNKYHNNWKLLES